MIDFLIPVSKSVLAHREILPEGVLGKHIAVHSNKGELPDLTNVKFALIGVKENRNDVDYIGEGLCFDAIRKTFYSLYPGNWTHNIIDLGDIDKGETVQDTYFALKSVISDLLKEKIIPLIMGGSQDLVYAQYRSYDSLGNMVNVVNVDSNFDIGDAENTITNKDKQSFYSFRHNFRNALRHANASDWVLQALGAWDKQKSVSDNYGETEWPDQLSEWVEKIEYPDLDLSHLYVK